MRLGDVPLGAEEIERIRPADLQPELVGELVQIERLGLCRVDAAEVDDQLLVDVAEEVVVPAERERLAALVGEFRW